MIGFKEVYVIGSFIVEHWKAIAVGVVFFIAVVPVIFDDGSVMLRY